MRKPLFLLLLAVLATTGLSAQHFGARVGVNFTNLKFNAEGGSVTFDNQTNLMLGVFADLPLGTGALLLSPELSYTGRGYNSEFEFFGQVTEQKVNLSYLDLGALLKYQFVNNGTLGVYAGAGPVIGYALSGTTEFDGEKEDIEFDDDDGFRRLNLFLAVAAGASFGDRFFVEGRFAPGISSLVDDEDTDEVDSARWQSFGINAGVRLPLGN